MESTFVSRYTGLFLFFLVVEQAIVASSTFWLTQLAKGIVGNGPLLFPFIGFTCSLTLVYIPSTLKNMYLAEAKVFSLERYIDMCSSGLRDVPHLSRSTAFQREKRSSIETESFQVIGETLDFANLSLGLLLNVVFNVSALCMAFGSHLLWAYILAAIIGIALTAGSARRVRSDSAAMQESRAGAYGALPGAWDAITLGNDYNRELWRADFGRKMAAYLSKASMAVRDIEMLTSLTLWAAVLPIVAVMAHAMFSKDSDAAMKAMILATFPRQIQVIQYTADIVNCLLNLSAVRERLAGLFRASMVDQNPKGMTGKIRQELISCVDAAGRRVELEGLTPPQAGRLTIRGENGSGKSSFLLELKRRNPEGSIILPAHHRLHFASVAETDVSTGQKLILIMEELGRVESIKLLLLDEWDANLDPENMQRIDAAIDRLAQRCCVVEVRHR